jgi:nicotinate phosphoribosyltransferase
VAGDTADVYFRRTDKILHAEGLNPLADMEIFAREEGILCGVKEVRQLLQEAGFEGELWSLPEGEGFHPKETAMRLIGRYNGFGIYETAILGMLASGSAWAGAARCCVEAAGSIPVISFGARHIHPKVADVMDYAAIVGGCATGSTPAGSALHGLAASGTMPHSLILLMGDTVAAAKAFDRYIEAEVSRIVLIDTFRDEVEESLRVAEALGDRLWGVRVDTPSERGGVTPDLVVELRQKLDLAGYHHVRIFVSSGLDPDKIRHFRERGAPIDGFGVGSYISGARPIDFTGDLREVDGRPVAKRGRLPGRQPNPRLQRLL